jgi:hypothetical protein
MHVKVDRQGSALVIQVSLLRDGDPLSWYSAKLQARTTPTINRLAKLPNATGAELSPAGDAIMVTFASDADANDAKGTAADLVDDLLEDSAPQG